jgi:hypothetical protein
MVAFLLGLVFLVLGYFVYGRFVAKTVATDPT